MLLLLLSFLFAIGCCQINQFSIIVDNDTRADLSQRTESIQGASVVSNTCEGVLPQYGGCQVVLRPDGSLQNITYKATWIGLGQFGFYATLFPLGSTVELGLLGLPQPPVNGSACYSYEAPSAYAVAYVSFCQAPNPCSKNPLCGRSQSLA
jgi:hypothetical protein